MVRINEIEMLSGKLTGSGLAKTVYVTLCTLYSEGYRQEDMLTHLGLWVCP